jgi:hypothetical protein
LISRIWKKTKANSLILEFFPDDYEPCSDEEKTITINKISSKTLYCLQLTGIW